MKFTLDRSTWKPLLVSLSLWLAGCGASGEDADRPITIVYWTRSWWGDPAQYQGDEPLPVTQWQREQIRRFEAEHPGVRVDLQIDPGGSGDKIRLAFAGGVPPDVFHGSPDTEFVTWAALGLLEPIDDYLTEADRADIYPGALQACAYAGKHYAWPLYAHALGVIINRDLFRQQGLEDRIPQPGEHWTMAEFEDLARRLTIDRDGDGRPEVYGVGLHALDDNHVFLTTYLINHGAQVFSRDGRFALDDPVGVAGLEFLRRLVDEGVATPGAAGYKYDDVRRLFVEQRVAMYLTSAGTLIWAQDQARKETVTPFDWALVSVPSVPGVEPTTYLTVGTVLVSRQNDPAKRDACMALARYLTGPRVNHYFWRVASPRRSGPLPQEAYLVAMRQQMERAQNFMLPPRPFEDRFDLSQEMVRLYQDVLSVPPKWSPARALRELGERVRRAMPQVEAAGP
ncbi:MAG TPA: sugar ABC transporter substrate-binding protein [Phycisphaeraceae bacterium]